MMLPPNRRPAIDLPPPGALLVAGRVIATVATDAGPNPPHADYNQQPLLVSGLEHYAKPGQDERFRVS